MADPQDHDDRPLARLGAAESDEMGPREQRLGAIVFGILGGAIVIMSIVYWDWWFARLTLGLGVILLTRAAYHGWQSRRQT